MASVQLSLPRNRLALQLHHPVKPSTQPDGATPPLVRHDLFDNLANVGKRFLRTVNCTLDIALIAIVGGDMCLYRGVLKQSNRLLTVEIDASNESAKYLRFI